METYAAGPVDALEKCLQDVRESGIYILLLGNKYGFIKEGMQESITHLEYKEAVKTGKPVFVFRADDGCNLPPDDNDETGIKKQKLLEFRNIALSKIGFAKPFDNPDNLAAQVLTALFPYHRTISEEGRDKIKNLIQPHIYNCDRIDQYPRVITHANLKTGYIIVFGREEDGPHEFFLRTKYAYRKVKEVPFSVGDGFFATGDAEKNRIFFYTELYRKYFRTAPPFDVLNLKQLFDELIPILSENKLMIEIEMTLPYFDQYFQTINTIVEEMKQNIPVDAKCSLFIFLTVKGRTAAEVEEKINALDELYKPNAITLDEVERNEIEDWIGEYIDSDEYVREQLFIGNFNSDITHYPMKQVITGLRKISDTVKNTTT
jgi:hypothetical protein